MLNVPVTFTVHYRTLLNTIIYFVPSPVLQPPATRQTEDTSTMMANTTSKVTHYYRKTEPPHSLLSSVKEQLKSTGCVEDAEKVESVETEHCFNIRFTQKLTDLERERLEWLLAETFDRANLRYEESCLKVNNNDDAGGAGSASLLVEFGPRMTFTSAFSSNAVSICQACGPLPVERLELSRRYLFRLVQDISPLAKATIKAMLHDRMTEQEYELPLATFGTAVQPKLVRTIPILAHGRAALEQINSEMGLGFDDFDLDYYTDLFKVRCQRCIFGEQTYVVV